MREKIVSDGKVSEFIIDTEYRVKWFWFSSEDSKEKAEVIWNLVKKIILFTLWFFYLSVGD